jgi:hypothetical protein
VTHPCERASTHGQAVAFVLRRQHRRIGMAVEGKQRLVVERGQPEDALAEVGMSGQSREHVVSHPPFAADNDEACILGLETVEGLKQNRVVLARLDGPDREEEAQRRKLGEGGGGSPSSALPGGAKSAPSLMTRMVIERERKRSDTLARSRATPAEVARA